MFALLCHDKSLTKKTQKKNKLKVKVRRNCHALAAATPSTRKLINVKAFERDGVITSSQQQQLQPLQQQQISCLYKVDKM